jgi:hypothetical protein
MSRRSDAPGGPAATPAAPDPHLPTGERHDRHAALALLPPGDRPLLRLRRAAPGPTGPAGGLPGLRGHQHRPAHRHLRAGPGLPAPTSQPASRIPDRRRSDDGRSMRRRAPPTHRTAARPRSDGWPAGNCLPLSSVDRAPAADSEALRTAHDRRPCSSFERSQRVPATYGVVGGDVRCHRRRRVRSSQVGRSAEAAR